MWIKRPHMDNPLMDDCIVNAINAELAAKGWTLVPEGADVSVAAHVATKKGTQPGNVLQRLRGWMALALLEGGMGAATTHVETYVVGTLVVDLFDSSTKQLIWRGWATDVLAEDPNKEAKKLDKEIEKLFKNFPPK